MSELHYLELHEISRKIQNGEVTSRAVTEALLARIETLDKDLNSFITVTADLALAQADNADAEIARGEIKGGLQGVPLALKDICDVKGVPTTAAMSIHLDSIADEDCTITQRLQDAGAVILGKLNMAHGVYSEQLEPFGMTINPWKKDVWSGSSSNGSGVATAAGFSYGAIGSDTGASIRLPATANSVTGLKPTWGRVSQHGVFELAKTLDHMGTMCRSALDCGIMLEAMAGYDPKDPYSSSEPTESYSEFSEAEVADLSDLTIGLDRHWITNKVDPQTAEAVLRSLEEFKKLGVKIKEITFPDPEQAIWDWFEICGPQTAYAHRETYPAKKDEYGPVFAGQIEQGLEMSAVDYQAAILRREAFTGQVQALFRDVDLLICPAIGCKVFTHKELESFDNDMISALQRFTCTFNMSRSPTITFPAGFNDEGVPLSTQLVGAHFDERRLVRAAHAYQQATDWHKKHPDL